MPTNETKVGRETGTPRIHKNINVLSMRCRLSQRRIGEAMGLSQAMVSRWVNASSTPDANQVAELSRLFDVPMEILVTQDVEAISDEALEKIRDVGKAIEMIGYEETHRRLLIAEPRVGKLSSGADDLDRGPLPRRKAR